MNAALRQAIERIAEGTSLRTEAEAELQGLEDYYKTAMLTPCADEQHCTCVPALRKRIEELEKEIEILKAGKG